MHLEKPEKTRKVSNCLQQYTSPCKSNGDPTTGYGFRSFLLYNSKHYNDSNDEHEKKLDHNHTPLTLSAEINSTYRIVCSYHR